MPIYQSRCEDCDVDAEYLRSVEECMNTPECPVCGVVMKKVILTAPKSFVRGKFEPFVSTVDGSLITTQRDMDEHNRRNNVVNMADGYDDATIKSGNFAKKEEKLDKKELVADIAEATYMVRNGYKPEVMTDDN